MTSARWSRRQFLHGSAATAGLLASPWRSLALPLPATEGAPAAALSPAPSAAAVTRAEPATRPIPLLRSTVGRPLRYTVAEGGYQIVNGRERHNRPLYGAAATLLAGDVPDLQLVFPGFVAHLRFAVVRRATARDLSELEQVTTRTHAGRVLYTLRDAALLGSRGELSLETLTTAGGAGAHVVLSGQALPPELALLVGLRLGTAPESTPRPLTSELLAVTGPPASEDPAACSGIAYRLAPGVVTVSVPGGEVTLALPEAAAAHLADAAEWNSGWEQLHTPAAQTPAGPQVLVLQLPGAARETLAPQHLELSFAPASPARPAAAVAASDPSGKSAAGTIPAPSASPQTPAAASAVSSTPTSSNPASPPTPADRLHARRAELQALSARVRVRTPEPRLDAAITQLNIVADGLWSPSAQSLTVGPGDLTPSPAWAAPPGLDALGVHDHVRHHLAHWAALQNVTPLPPGTEPDGPVAAPPDSGTGLARKASMLNSNGTFGPADRDTSLALLESMVRHLRWTGDLEFAKALWPAIQRGLDRQYRLFRREVPDPESHYLLKPKLPAPELALYESYGSLSPTDGIAYSGAGVAHATARNLFLNREAAVLARLLGQEALAYDTEAALLDRSLRKLLWQASRGCFAESLDTLLPQTLSTEPGLWTASRVVDAECVSAREAWQIVTERLAAHVPVPATGPGLPEPNLTRITGTGSGPASATPQPVPSATLAVPSAPTPFLLPSSTWFGDVGPTAPGAGVASLQAAESARMAFALWNAGEPDIAFALLDGVLLDSTARGLVPGNLHHTSALDPLLGETGIDSPDTLSAIARAVVEGLFGVNPDLLRASLTIRPGFPSSWTDAELHHPDLDLTWSRKDLVEHFTITNRLSQPATLTLNLPARATGEPLVLLAGKPVPARFDPNSTPAPRLLVEDLPAAPSWTIEVRWRGKPPIPVPARVSLIAGEAVPLPRGLPADSAGQLDDPQICLLNGAAAAPGDHAVFARVVDGNCAYWLPIPLHIVPTSVTTSAEADFPTAHSRFEPLPPALLFDGFLTETLTRTYRSPRSPLCSLGVPEHLLGDSFAPGPPLSISDRALRTAPRAEVQAFGIPFVSPAPENAPNCRFVSSWKEDRDAFALSLHGRASALHLLVATVPLVSAAAAELGVVRVRYIDGSEARLSITAAGGAWPIDRDLFLDDFVFPPPRSTPAARRLDLATGETRTIDPASFSGAGRPTPNGSASVLTLPLTPDRDLAAMHVETSRYGSVIAILGATLARLA